MIERLRTRISVANWDRLPPVLWFLIASPLLGWAFDKKVTWTWPARDADSGRWWRWDPPPDYPDADDVYWGQDHSNRK